LSENYKQPVNQQVDAATFRTFQQNAAAQHNLPLNVNSANTSALSPLTQLINQIGRGDMFGELFTNMGNLVGG